MKEKIGTYDNQDMYLQVCNYTNNKRLYMGLVTEEEPYSDITINLPDVGISEGYVYLSNDIDDNLKQFLIDNKVISDTIVYMKYNYGEYRMVKWNKDTVKRLDPNGYEMYQKDLKKTYSL